MRVLLALLLAGCAATKETPVFHTDGQPAFLAQCQKLHDCHDAARARCGAYLPLKEAQALAGGGVMVNGQASHNIRTTHSLTYRCQ